jgi:hypothetical protein
MSEHDGFKVPHDAGVAAPGQCSSAAGTANGGRRAWGLWWWWAASASLLGDLGGAVVDVLGCEQSMVDDEALKRGNP